MSGRTDTERLEWMLAREIRVEHSIHDPFAEFTIQFKALVPKERGSIRDLGDLVRHAVDAMMDFVHIPPPAPDPRRERLARAMTTHSSRPWEDMNENTRKLHLAEADRLLAAIDGRDEG